MKKWFVTISRRFVASALMKPCPIRFVSFCSTPSAHHTAVFATQLPAKSRAHVRSGCLAPWSVREVAVEERCMATSPPRTPPLQRQTPSSERRSAGSETDVPLSEYHAAPSECHLARSDRRAARSECHVAGSDRHVPTYNSHATTLRTALYEKTAKFDQKPTNNQNQCLH